NDNRHKSRPCGGKCGVQYSSVPGTVRQFGHDINHKSKNDAIKDRTTILICPSITRRKSEYDEHVTGQKDREGQKPEKAGDSGRSEGWIGDILRDHVNQFSES